jgi:hypothetical protein
LAKHLAHHFSERGRVVSPKRIRDALPQYVGRRSASDFVKMLMCDIRIRDSAAIRVLLQNIH